MNETTLPQPDDILSAIYDVALSPDRYARLLTHMGQTDQGAHALPEHILLTHFRRAELILARDTTSIQQNEITELMGRFANSTALLVNTHLEVLATHGPTDRIFGVGLGGNLRRAEMPEDVRAQVLSRVHKTLAPRSAPTEPSQAPVQVPQHPATRPILLQFHAEHLPQTGPVALVFSSELIWPDGFETVLSSAFGLTRTECEVVRRLIKSETIAEIADARGRSIDTVRTQVKTILNKTETRSQAELVRTVFMMIQMASTASAHRKTHPPIDAIEKRCIAPLDSFTLADGRRLDYRDFGAEGGQPVVVWPMDYCFARWPKAAEEQARAMGLRVILPLRGGYGPSDAPAPQGLLSDHYARDIHALLTHLGIGPCPHLAMGVDVMFAARYHALFPGHITSLIGCGAVFPITEARQVDAMDKWHRMILATARNAPRLLPFLVKAGFALALKTGKEGFMHKIFADSPGDLALLGDIDTREALFDGTRYTLSEHHNAAAVFTRTAIEQMTRDWRSDLRALEASIPVHFLQGQEDPQIPPDILADHRAAYPGISFESLPHTGRFVFFRHWQRTLSLVAENL